MTPRQTWWLKNTTAGRRLARRSGLDRALGIPEDPTYGWRVHAEVDGTREVVEVEARDRPDAIDQARRKVAGGRRHLGRVFGAERSR